MLKRNKSVLSLGGILLVSVFSVVLSVVLSGAVVAETRFEHVAINVDNPKAVADWYAQYLGLVIVSASKKMIFVRDAGGHFMFELYSKPEAKGSYASLSHASSHVAFAVDDAEAMSKKMVEGGAKILNAFTNPVGDRVVNMRDPWGNMLQVIHRVKPKL